LQPAEILLRQKPEKHADILMLTFPNAKINIGLSITARRADGYHDLETIFYPVAVRDALEIIDTQEKQPSLHVSGLPVAGDPDKNLALKAYHLLLADFPEKVKPLSIHLHKLIPMGAGLGGGSADGAFMLSMMNEYFNLDLPLYTLEQYALQLGSDCPFFIRNKPVFASGRGEQLEELTLDLSEYSIQFIFPELHISTAIAFSGITPAPAPYPLRNIVSLPVLEWKHKVINDFEQSLFPKYPMLAQAKDQLYAGGALYASLSGTGSTVYGIFKKGERAEVSIDGPFSQQYLVDPQKG
jgi:4-diphosphocytidyl-2-C-methyl-D-erythritol kinase